MSTEIKIPPANTERHSSPSSASTITVTGSNLLLGFFAFVCVSALCLSIYAIGRADAATDRAQIAERETRILEDDFKYVRAWTQARGGYLPSSHEEAEEREPSHHHQHIELASQPGSNGYARLQRPDRDANDRVPSGPR